MKAADLYELVGEASLVDLLQLLEEIGNELRARGFDPEGFKVLEGAEAVRRRYYGAIRPAAPAAAEISGDEYPGIAPGDGGGLS